MVSDETRTKEKMVDAAEMLFSKKGFKETSVDDICDEVGVAHGLFYYYFDSKDAIIEAISHKMIKDIESSLTEMVDRSELTADEKFLKFISSAFQKKKDKPYLLFYFSKDNDLKLYHLLFDTMVETTTPYLKEIVEQGIEENIFDTEYPEQTIRLWLNGRMFLTGDDLLIGEEIMEEMKAEAYMLERLLGAKDRFLSSFYEEHGREIKGFIQGTMED